VPFDGGEGELCPQAASPWRIVRGGAQSATPLAVGLRDRQLL